MQPALVDDFAVVQSPAKRELALVSCSARRRLRVACRAARLRYRDRAVRERHPPRQARRQCVDRTSTRWCAIYRKCASATRSSTNNMESAATWGSSRWMSARARPSSSQLIYANDAKLYVPVSSLHLIGRYSGASPDAAPLHELGSGQWEKAKKQGGAASARHRSRASQHLRAARGAQRPRVHSSSRTITRRSPKASPSRKRRTSRRRSTRSSTTSRRASRWTGSCAATSVSARPKSRCALHSSRSPTAGRSRCWCRRRCSPSSTSRSSPTASPSGR